MSGEQEWMQGVLQALLTGGLTWVIGEIAADWAAAGFPSTMADDGTLLAARQVLSATETIEVSVLPQLEAVNYLRINVPDAVGRDATQIDGRLDLIEAMQPDAFGRDADAIGGLEQFVGRTREEVHLDWPDVDFAAEDR